MKEKRVYEDQIRELSRNNKTHAKCQKEVGALKKQIVTIKSDMKQISANVKTMSNSISTVFPHVRIVFVFHYFSFKMQ